MYYPLILWKWFPNVIWTRSAWKHSYTWRTISSDGGIYFSFTEWDGVCLEDNVWYEVRNSASDSY